MNTTRWMDRSRRSTRALGAVVGLAALGGAPRPLWALPEKTSYDAALGQVDLGFRRPNSVDGAGLSGPAAAAIDRAHQPTPLYIADTGNARVLGWRDATSFRNGAPADLVLGQPDARRVERFGKDARAISRPAGLAVDKDGTVWVSDADNGRVLGFRWPFDPDASAEDARTADFLIGQLEFSSGYPDKSCNGSSAGTGPAAGASADTLCEPAGLATDPAGNLYVADRLNHRVLVFKAPIADRYARASAVFGHSTMSGTMRCNRSAGVTTPDETTLCGPQGVFVDAQKGPITLWVADTDNHRVLGYRDPLGTDQSADLVLGQRGFKDSLPGTGMDKLNKPGAVWLDGGGNVWVSDTGSHRVLGFAAPMTSGVVASYLIGQLDTSGTQPNQGVFGRPVPTPTASSLWSPRAGVFDGKGRLILPDAGNHRVLAYDNPGRIGAVATKELGQPDFVHGAEGRTGPDGLAYPVGLAVDRPDPQARPGEPAAVYVADFGNSRVLGWRSLYALRSGKPADLVIGQKGMLDHACNQGKGVSAETLCYPRGLVVDKEGDLWVADTWNHRVLRFPRPFAQGAGPQVANLVLGQPSFLGGLSNVNGAGEVTLRSMASPAALALEDGGVLWVADRDNQRVIGFAPPFSSSAAASYVLVGKGLGATQAGCPMNAGSDYLCGPSGVAVDPQGGLWVADRDNNRVSRYASRPSMMGSPLLSPVPLAVLGQPNLTSVAANNNDPKHPTRATLLSPEGVAVELTTGSDGKPQAASIVVADSGNNRVLVYAPLTMGFGPEAIAVFGQNGSFERQGQNLEASSYDRAENVARGLFNPGAVVALPDALLIADSGDTSRMSKAGFVQPIPGDTGNSRVLLVKAEGFPTMYDDLDMASPRDLGGADLGPEEPPPSGCSCDLGRGGETAGPGALAGLLLLGLLLRRRR